jgi:methyl-accepting chemotaxis protein
LPNLIDSRLKMVFQKIPDRSQGFFGYQQAAAQDFSNFPAEFCIIGASNQKVIEMTDEELKTLVAGLATATAKNTESIDRNVQTVERSAQAIDRNSLAIDNLRESAQLQAQSIENLREGLSYNTQIVTDGLELAAASNRTAAATMELVTHTARAIDQLRNEIADLKQIVGIMINDSRADRSRIRSLEDQN